MNTQKNNNQKNKAPPAGPPVLRRQSASELLRRNFRSLCPSGWNIILYWHKDSR